MYSCTVNAYDWLTSESQDKSSKYSCHFNASESVSGLCSIYVVFNTVLVGTKSHFSTKTTVKRAINYTCNTTRTAGTKLFHIN